MTGVPIKSTQKSISAKRISSQMNKSAFIDNLQLFILSLPTIIHLFIFSYIPMFGVILAFKFYRVDMGIFKSPWVGWNNFKFFFLSEDAWRITRNTIGLNVLFLVVGTIAAVAFALLLFEIKQRLFLKFYQTVAILPSFISWVVVSFIAYIFLDTNKGVLNGILVSLGTNKIEWYTQPQYWPAILLIATIWKGIGMSSIMYFASLMGIDDEYFDAAKIDGATKWQVTWNITIPFLVPMIVILGILHVGHMFRADFGLFYNLPRNIGALYPTTDVIDTYVFRALRNANDIGMSSAVGLFQSFVGFVLIMVTNFIVRKIEPDNSLF